MICHRFLESLPDELQLNPDYVLKVSPYTSPAVCLLEHNSGSIVAVLSVDETSIRIRNPRAPTPDIFGLYDPELVDKIQALCERLISSYQQNRQ